MVTQASGFGAPTSKPGGTTKLTLNCSFGSIAISSSMISKVVQRLKLPAGKVTVLVAGTKSSSADRKEDTVLKLAATYHKPKN